ncbi:serine/threonine protein phosphatase 1 [Paraburkholderia sp. HC6.4b]|uniref:metallophosphoesterase n=1 Tax=unclassified Paraburkholderia TaxID=2615204 RepID=UPI00161562FF|nr:MULTISPECIES: metallophosphoesterase [unclassified Paraburkholderia]MBB5409242.1 serine/threonine protein phosphatase 1 [Paraburkholderia sp. HC6.4b]MBB5450970.1 serine/threonine protein phosphatase 1 [Paraburkholderia sp. Kb1A]
MIFHEHFARNTKGRDLVAGDIHGMFSALSRVLDVVGFDRDADRLFCTGDLVDRGPESDRVLEWLNYPWFHPVRGNHDDYTIRWPRGTVDAATYLSNSGGWNIENVPELQQRFSDALDRLPVAIEVETEAGMVGIVHADCPVPSWRDFVTRLGSAKVPAEEREHLAQLAIWARARILALDPSCVRDIHAVVVGHTPVSRHGTLGNVHYIDTGAVFEGGHFTLLDLASLTPVYPAASEPNWHA